MDVLVTGGAGFIGSHVVDLLVSEGYDAAVVDDLSTGRVENLPAGVDFHHLDVSDARTAALIREARPDYIIHQAAQISVARSVREPSADAAVNVLGTLSLLEAAVAAGVKGFVFASSGGTIYGDLAAGPADTGPYEAVSEEAPFRPVSPYGIAKAACEHYLRFFSREYGLTCVSLRYANVYGPRQDPHGEAGVVAIFANRMLRGEQPTINGDGRYVRDYVYVGDVARANLLALRYPGSGAFNIGTGQGTDVNELFGILSRLCDYGGKPRYGPARPGDLRASVLDPSLAARELNWRPRIPLDEGLAATVAYFRPAAIN